MATQQNPTSAVLSQMIEEWGARVRIDAGSRILVSSPQLAKDIADLTKAVATPYGPTIVIAARDKASASKATDASAPNTTTEAIDDLKMDHFTHAIADVSSEGGKACMTIMKHAHYALAPKGIFIVIALKRDGLLERISGESKGRVSTLSDVVDFAGFERGKIRGMEKTADGVEADVVLAMKWDQLTA